MYTKCSCLCLSVHQAMVPRDQSIWRPKSERGAGFPGKCHSVPASPPCIFLHTLVTAWLHMTSMPPRCHVVRLSGMWWQQSVCIFSTWRICLSFRMLSPLSVGCWLDTPKSKKIQSFWSTFSTILNGDRLSPGRICYILLFPFWWWAGYMWHRTAFLYNC